MNRIVFALIALLCLQGTAQAQNFTAVDSTYAQAAESARVQSAVFWTGHELPGRWWSACPIEVRERAGANNAAAGGRTTFSIADGEVFGWRMTAEGNRGAVLWDVIPHEVDHMVRATLVRQPVPRWLDEGCATLMESAESHEHLRGWLAKDQKFSITPKFLEQSEYPTDGGAVQRLYAGGFSLVEFLYDTGGPAQLLELHRGDEPIVQRMRRIYGCSLGELTAKYQDWRAERGSHVACDEVHCAVHRSGAREVEQFFCPCTNPPENLLTAYGAEWCGACRKFWSDLKNDEGFRAAILGRFHLHRVDVDRQPRLVRQAAIRSLPTFIGRGVRIEGYAGPDSLLKQLGLTRVSAPALASGSGKTPPAPTAAEPKTERSPAATAASPAISVTPVAPEPVAKAAPVVTPPAASPMATAGRVAAGAARAAPIALTVLQLLGIVGGTVATGGIGGVAIALALGALRRAGTGIAAKAGSEEGAPASGDAPFPRHLDEARQLLAIRKSEGRVAALDALRGMFLEDEVGKLTGGDDAVQKAFATQLLSSIDARVAEVAPLATSVDSASN
jgi:hypothetical protein